MVIAEADLISGNINWKDLDLNALTETGGGRGSSGAMSTRAEQREGQYNSAAIESFVLQVSRK